MTAKFELQMNENAHQRRRQKPPLSTKNNKTCSLQTYCIRHMRRYEDEHDVIKFQLQYCQRIIEVVWCLNISTAYRYTNIIHIKQITTTSNVAYLLRNARCDSALENCMNHLSHPRFAHTHTTIYYYIVYERALAHSHSSLICCVWDCAISNLSSHWRVGPFIRSVAMRVLTQHCWDSPNCQINSKEMHFQL